MRYVLQVISRAQPGRDAEYNSWYDQIHVHEVLAVPGFVSCERFVRDAADSGGQPDYISLYEVETDDPQVLLQSMFSAAESMQMSDTIDPTSVSFDFLRPSGGGRVMRKA